MRESTNPGAPELVRVRAAGQRGWQLHGSVGLWPVLVPPLIEVAGARVDFHLKHSTRIRPLRTPIGALSCLPCFTPQVQASEGDVLESITIYSAQYCGREGLETLQVAEGVDAVQLGKGSYGTVLAGGCLHLPADKWACMQRSWR